MLKRIFYITLLVAYAGGVGAQDAEYLRMQNIKIKKQITYTNKLLDNLGESTQAQLSRISIIENKINFQQQLIQNIKSQINRLDEELAVNQKTFKEVEDRFNQLKDEYAKIIMVSARTQNIFTQWMYILAADDLNKMYKRILYLQQYSEYRKSQGAEILQLKYKMDAIIDTINVQKMEQEKLLVNRKNEISLLDASKRELQAVMNQLRKREDELKILLAKQQEEKNELHKSISEVLDEEQKSVHAKEDVINLAASNDKVSLVSTIFEKSKGQLDWPVKSGIITSRFGKHDHPVLKGITVVNDGIDIKTVANGGVYAVFQGTVSKIINIPGLNKGVIIKHGEYFSLYSNLQTVSVVVNQQVKAGTQLGVVFSNPRMNLEPIIKFQIWHNTEKLNPQHWLKNRP